MFLWINSSLSFSLGGADLNRRSLGIIWRGLIVERKKIEYKGRCDECQYHYRDFYVSVSVFDYFFILLLMKNSSSEV
jgi:hypothetical protein